MTKLPSVIFVQPQMNIGLKVEEWLLEAYNCSLANTGNELETYDWDYPDAKRIIPIFGDEIVNCKALSVYDDWCNWRTGGNWYYYNCGYPGYNGLDEPGSRGDKRLRYFNYARAYQEVEMVRACMPGLQLVVTHPYPVGVPIEWPRIQPDVCAWRYEYIKQKYLIHKEKWREKYGIPPDAEVWAYLIYEDIRDMDLGSIGDDLHRFGCDALLINTIRGVKLLADFEGEVPKLTDKGKALLEGMMSDD